MKFCIKHMVTASAMFMAISGAHAADTWQWQLTSGTGSLTFTQDALAVFSATGAQVLTAGTVPSITGIDIGGVANAATYTKSTGTLDLTFNGVSTGHGAVNALQAGNAFVELRRQLINNDDSVSTYSVFLTGLSVNYNLTAAPFAPNITANIYSKTNEGALVSYGTRTIFQSDVPGVTGGTKGYIVEDYDGTGFYPAGHVSGSFAPGGSLRMDLGTADIVLSGLGLPTIPTNPLTNLVLTTNWGDTHASATLQAVPEPSAYVMFGIGMLTVGALARRRRET